MTQKYTIKTATHAALLASSILGVVSLPSNSNADVDLAQWWNDDSYVLLMSHMPDFDQRRAGSNGLSAGGARHCGPTSCANLLAYIATHGFPSIEPMRADYADTTNQTLYNRVTDLIDELGVEMRIDAWGGQGTLQTDRFNSMTSRLSAYFTVSSFRRPTNFSWWPNLDDLARSGIDNGTIMALNYGYYNWTVDTNGRIDLNQRNGGHAVAFSAASSNSGRMVLGVSDSTTDSQESNLQQSAFELRLWDVDEFLVNGPNSTANTANFLSDGEATSQDGTGDRVLEGYMTIQPRTGLSWDRFNNDFFVLGPTWDVWMNEVDPVRHSGNTLMRIRDLQFDPDMLDPILLDEDTRTLVRFPVGSAMPEMINLERDNGQIDCFAIDRHRNLIVFSGSSIRRYGFDNPGQATFNARMPANVTTLSVNDTRDEIMVLMGEIGHVGYITNMHTTRPRLSMKRLPRDADWSSATRILRLESDTLAIVMANGELRHFQENGRVLNNAPIQLHGVANGTIDDIALDDQGALLVASGATVNALRPLEDNAWQMDPTHIFHGMACGDRFVPSRSRTNLDENHDLNKDDDIGDGPANWIFKRCRGDVNWDQRVDERDVTQVLESIGQDRGAEDLNRDGTVNVLDLVIVITNIGECN